MKRHDAVESVSRVILNGGLVEALFLKGSIARNEDDDYSDVDMYALVSEENKSEFMKKRLDYLQSYMPLVFWTESNFVASQIVGVYENALHFDLYTVTEDKLPKTDDIKILYDKNNILSSYKKQPLGVSEEFIFKEIDEFTFTMLEIETAYRRNDFIWTTKLIHVQTDRISLLLRYIYDKDNARLRSRGLYKNIPGNIYGRYIDLLENAVPSNLARAIRLLVEFEADIISMLPESIQNKYNIDFKNLINERITRLI